MSIFGRILDKLRGHAQAAPAGPAGGPPQSPAPSDDLPTAAPAGAASAMAQVDVEAILNGLAQKASQRLDWRHSIVDLMKLLDLDSSLEARKSLAQELHFSGDTNDSASMNIWLHKQVMQKLAENGGKVPAELRD
ncbi:DUF3597 domain-containing protein [Belnapia sp. T6]|uniref:DUF3597 domain-containing protein n=1 Tax=Belnapia mucosa TaxID=2804532 RepID=A0ABS1VBM2_9PROT|nr:DUF3597 domain-containing protein [Belnapia mucosa]MBL6457778.1 DUF3597 domain-containing protein [Belnapia mucosa]